MKRVIRASRNSEYDFEALLEGGLEDMPLYEVRRLASNPDTPEEVLDELANDRDWTVRMKVAENPSAPVHILEKLASDHSKWAENVRVRVARNANTPKHVLEDLCKDENRMVKAEAQKRVKSTAVIKSGTDYKRIDNAKAFDNGRVLHNDWIQVSDEEAEEMARQKSLEDPRGIYYVKYDDIMNPSSDIKWVNGRSYTDYKEALDASRPENFDELYRQNFEKSYR